MKKIDVSARISRARQYFKENIVRQCIKPFTTGLLITVATVGANAQGPNFEWVKGMGGSDFDQSLSVAADGYGNSYVTGFYNTSTDFKSATGIITLTTAGSSDGFLAKYGPTGDCLWARNLGGDGNDQGNVVAVDIKGNVYVTGSFSSTNFAAQGSTTTYASVTGNYDAFLVKYDSAGNYRWTKTMGGDENDVSNSVVIDSSYNVYVTGTFGSLNFAIAGSTATYATAGQGDMFIAKYDSSGNYDWAKVMGGTDNDESHGIAIGRHGNIYVGGFFNGTANFNPAGKDTLTAVGVSDLFIAKYDSSGNYRWAKRMGGFGDDYGFGVAVDGNDNVYTTGYITGSSTFDGTTATVTILGAYDILMAKYDSAGNYVWAENIGGTANDYNQAFSIATDGGNNVYIAGVLNATADFDPGAGNAVLTSVAAADIFVAKYDQNGTYRWAKNMGGSSYEQGKGVAVDRSGYTYVTGYFLSTPVDFNIGSNVDTLSPLNNSADGFLVKYACGDTTSSYLAVSQCEKEYTFNGVVYNTSGTYTQKFPNATGCDSTVTLALAINPVVKPQISVNGFDLGTTLPYTTYQWLLNGVAIQNATGAVYTVTKNGSYQVVAGNASGCSDTSIVYIVTNVGVENLASVENSISVYPNPSSDVVNIFAPIAVNASLYSIEGRMITQTADAQKVSLKAVAEGMYMLHITDKDGNLIKVVKVVKQK